MRLIYYYLFQGLARLGADVTGIDASMDLIALAQEHRNVDPKIANNKPEYINCTIEVNMFKLKLLIILQIMVQFRMDFYYKTPSTNRKT